MSVAPSSTARPSVARAGRGWHVRRQDVVALGITALLAVGGLAAAGYASAWQKVWFVNGLDVPVRIEVGGHSVAIAPQARESRGMRVGPFGVTVRSEDRIVEQTWIDVPRFSNAVVYNVLGAAPLYTATITYSSANVSRQDPQIDFQAGSRLVTTSRVDFPFEEPPEQIKVKSGDRHTRVQMDVAEGGWSSTVAYLGGQGQLARAGRLSRAIAAAEPGHPSVRNVEMLVWLGEGAHAVARLTRTLRDAMPADRDAHASYQHAMRRAGLGAAALAEYRDRERKAPDSALEALMRVRLEPAERAPEAYAQLLERFPGNADVLRSAATNALYRDDAATAVQRFDPIAKSPGHARWADDHARALVAVGRAAEAFALLDGMPTTTPQDELNVLLTRAQLAVLTGAAAPKREPAEPGAAAWMRSVLGEPAAAPEGNGALATVLEIHTAARTDAARARSLCATAAPFAISQLHAGVSVLLAAELERAGEVATARRVWSSATMQLDREVVLAWLFQGTDHPELTRIDPEARAALDFVRARVLTESGDARGAEAAMRAATKRDALRGPVSKAMADWAAPDVADEQHATFVYQRSP